MKLVWEVKGIINKEFDITDWSEAVIKAYLIGENDKKDTEKVR